MIRWSLYWTLGLVAFTASLVVAPQAALLVLRSSVDNPSPLLHFTGMFFYEFGLWGTGLAVWIAGQKLGWLSSFSFLSGFFLCTLPAVSEFSLSLMLGQIPPGFAHLEGIVLKFAFGIGSYAVAKKLFSQYQQPTGN